MNGPDHYRCAEQCISEAYRAGNRPEAVAVIMAEAQVHATLALAAATLEFFKQNNLHVSNFL